MKRKNIILLLMLCCMLGLVACGNNDKEEIANTQQSESVGATETQEIEVEVTETQETEVEATETVATEVEATETEITETEKSETEKPKTEEPKKEATETEKPKTETTKTEKPKTEKPKKDVNGIKKLLKNEWKDKYAPKLDSKFDKYVKGYDGYLALIKVDGDTMTISASNYDGDAKDSFIVRKVKLAKDISYSELTIKTVITEEGEKSTDNYTELTREDMELILDSTLGVGFVWFNEDMEIEKIMFYGALTIWE